jgi:hypothetical protein
MAGCGLHERRRWDVGVTEFDGDKGRLDATEFVAVTVKV